MKRATWDIHTASAHDAQRRRVDARAKPLRNLEPHRVCVVVGGKGRFLTLAAALAVRVGHGYVEAGAPAATVDRIQALGWGRPPRVVVIAPNRVAAPILAEIRRRAAWPAPLNLLQGLRSRDREVFLRQALRQARRP